MWVQWVCYVSSQRYQKLWKQGLDSPIFNASRPNFDVRQPCGIARPRKFLLHPAKALLHRVKALAFGVQHFKFIPFPNPHCHYVIHRLSTKHWISYPIQVFLQHDPQKGSKDGTKSYQLYHLHSNRSWWSHWCPRWDFQHASQSLFKSMFWFRVKRGKSVSICWYKTDGNINNSSMQ